MRRAAAVGVVSCQTGFGRTGKQEDGPLSGGVYKDCGVRFWGGKRTLRDTLRLAIDGPLVVCLLVVLWMPKVVRQRAISVEAWKRGGARHRLCIL